MALSLAASSIIELHSSAPRPRLRSADSAPHNAHRDAVVWSAVAMPDRGLIVAGRSRGGVTNGGRPHCATGGDGFVIRFDATGSARWTRCFASPQAAIGALIAVSDTTLWVARAVADAPDSDGVHDGVRDLLAVERWSVADGAPIDRRVVAVRHDDAFTSSAGYQAERAAASLSLRAATLASGELLIAGESDAGQFVDGQWHVRGGSAMHGFVLAVSEHETRSVIEVPRGTFNDIAVAGKRFIMTGACYLSSDPPDTCASGPGPFAITGELDAPATWRTRVFTGPGVHDAHGAIDGDGGIIVAATSSTAAWSGLPPVVIDGVAVDSSCDEFSFVAAWTSTGALRFARPLGECGNPPRRPVTDSSRDITDDTHYSPTVLQVAAISHRVVLAIQIPGEINSRDRALHFDDVAVRVPRGSDGLVVVLDERGRVVEHRRLAFSSARERDDNPDTGLVDRVGVLGMRFAVGVQSWLVIDYAGAIRTAGRQFAASTGVGPDTTIGVGPEGTRSLTASDCAGYDLASPYSGSSRDDVKEYQCRQRVIADVAVVALPLAIRP
jgi:hypothetical protein